VQQSTQDPRGLSPREGRQVAFYFGALALAIGLGSPGGHGSPAGVALLPVRYFLNDHLHLGPQAVSAFFALISIPLYAGFLFGFLRDRWRPKGWGDRGYLLAAAPVVAGCYLWLARGRVDYPRLLGAILLASVAFQLLNTAAAALMTMVAQRCLMTGRLGAVAGIAAAAPGVLAALAGGWLAAHVSAQQTFFLGALMPLAILAQAFWRLPTVEAGEPTVEASRGGSLAEFRRLLGHRPLWPAAAVCLLWDFAPGWGTALWFYLAKEIKLSPEMIGVNDSASAACTAAGAVLYGLFCQRWPLKRLLWWSLALGILCGPLYIFIRTAAQAIAIAVVGGLLQGFTNAGFRGDLLMRSCPRGLEGSGRMLGAAASAIAVGSGDYFGAWLFERGGFGLCLVITTCTTALIMPVLLLLPRHLMAARDGGEEAEVAEIPSPTSHRGLQAGLVGRDAA
jgi:hypothetical protein